MIALSRQTLRLRTLETLRQLSESILAVHDRRLPMRHREAGSRTAQARHLNEPEEPLEEDSELVQHDLLLHLVGVRA